MCLLNLGRADYLNFSSLVAILVHGHDRARAKLVLWWEQHLAGVMWVGVIFFFFFPWSGG